MCRLKQAPAVCYTIFCQTAGACLSLPLTRLVIAFAILSGMNTTYSHAQQSDQTQLLVRKTDDFQVNGTGDNSAWAKTDWLPISIQESDGRNLATKTKTLYSGTGIYFLFQCDDEK